MSDLIFNGVSMFNDFSHVNFEDRECYMECASNELRTKDLLGRTDGVTTGNAGKSLCRRLCHDEYEDGMVPETTDGFFEGGVHVCDMKCDMIYVKMDNYKKLYQKCHKSKRCSNLFGKSALGFAKCRYHVCFDKVFKTDITWGKFFQYDWSRQFLRF